MTKSHLQGSIEEAANRFAMTIVDAIKSATLQDIVGLQEQPAVRLGRKPGRKPGPKTGTVKVVERKAAKPTRRKRVVKNYPKCAYPGCGSNRFPRGKGFCGEHWRSWQAGKIKDAEQYKKKPAKNG